MFGALQVAYHRWDILRRIRKHGWSGTHVPGDPVPFSYTTGFQDALGAPEMIIFGADLATGGQLFSVAFDQLKSGELKMEDQADWPLDLEGGPRLGWRAVHPSQLRREHFNVAIWNRERRGLNRHDLQAFQLVVSDRAHVLPWEDGYDEDYQPRQKALWLPYFGPAADD